MDTSRLQQEVTRLLEKALHTQRAIDAIRDVDLPSEAEITSYGLYAYGPTSAAVTVTVTVDETLPWSERIRPIGQTLRAFRARKIKREVQDSGIVDYGATIRMREDETTPYTIYLTVRVPVGGISPVCTVETVEEEYHGTRKRIVVTCPEPVSPGVRIGAV